MRGYWAVACLLLASMYAHAGFSNGEPASMSRFEQRQLYREAIHDITRGDPAAARRLAARLTDYPLYPYIEYTTKIYNLGHEPASDILSFRDRYKDSPIAQRLMENWVYVLARQGKWAEFLKYYDPAVSTSKHNACSYAYALYREGREQAAFAQARKLWLVDYSQPEECDHIFRLWRESGQFDSEAAWQRYVMAMQSGEISLANYLKRFLNGKDKRLANEFTRVRRYPGGITQYSRYKEDGVRARQLILYGVSRLAYRHPDAAFRALSHYAQTHNFSADALDKAYARIGVRMAQTGDKGNLLDSLPVNLRQNEPLTEARIRMSLRQLDWAHVLVFMNLLPADEQASSRWQFWKARVLMGSPSQADQAAARDIFGQLATTRNFYGFMSADAIGTKYDFGHASANISTPEILAVEKLPGIQRALELFTLNEHPQARSEWYFATRSFNDHQREVAARVAQKWGWYRQAIKSTIDANAWSDLNIRFPLAYYDTFVSSARKWDIPLQWSLAIARQESAFMPDAHSRAGAIGIMQILPHTARLTARRQGLDYEGSRELKQPAANIRIGSAYLGRLLREFNNNRILASAAYNAGPARVYAWIDPSLPVDVWIETLPFPETRHYVENVLMFTVIYSYRLAQPHPLIYQHELGDFSNQEVTLNNTVLMTEQGADVQSAAD